jgi:hypothetical protein
MPAGAQVTVSKQANSLSPCLRVLQQTHAFPFLAVDRKRTLPHFWQSGSSTHFPISRCLQETYTLPFLAVYRKHKLSHFWLSGSSANVPISGCRQETLTFPFLAVGIQHTLSHFWLSTGNAHFCPFANSRLSTCGQSCRELARLLTPAPPRAPVANLYLQAARSESVPAGSP